LLRGGHDVARRHVLARVDARLAGVALGPPRPAGDTAADDQRHDRRDDPGRALVALPLSSALASRGWSGHAVLPVVFVRLIGRTRAATDKFPHGRRYGPPGARVLPTRRPGPSVTDARSARHLRAGWQRGDGPRGPSR